MGFFKDLKSRVRSQVQPPMSPRPTSMGNKFDRMFGMSRQSPMPPRSGFNPFRDPPRYVDPTEERRPRATPVNPSIQSVRDLVIENINTGALPPEGMSMPTAPNEAGLMPLPRPRDKFKPRNKFMPGRFPTRFTACHARKDAVKIP